MTRTTIYHSDRFDLVSYGNGTAYALHDNVTHKSIFLQGDDAAAFRREWGLFRKTCPEASFDVHFEEQIALYE